MTVLWDVAPWILVTVMAAVWIAILLLRRLWRDPRPRPAPAADAPPDDLGMLAAAELLRRPQAAVPALLAESVTSGAATLTEVPGPTEQHRYRLAVRDPSRLAQPDDRAALEQLFSGVDPSAGLLLDRGDERLTHRLTALQSEAAASLRTRRLVTGPRNAATLTLRIVTVLAMLGALAVFLDVTIRTADPVRAAVAVAVLVAGGFALRPAGMPDRLTARGAAVRDRLVAHNDRLRHEEDQLPWFIVAGLDTSWSTALPADALITLGAFGHTVASTRVNGPIIDRGMATANGLWTGSTNYDSLGRFGSSGASR